MSTNFDAVWSDIQQRLKPGETIQTWSADSGYTGGCFRVVNVNSNSARVDAEALSVLKDIPEKEFGKIFVIWPAYCSGATRRSKLRHGGMAP